METLSRMGVSSLEELAKQSWFQTEANRVAQETHIGRIIGFYLEGNSFSGDNRKLILVGENGVVPNNFTGTNSNNYRLISGIPKPLVTF
jgi:hypothetical protein